MKNHWKIGFAGFLLLLGGAAPLFAQPDLTQKAGKTIAETGSEQYRFVRFRRDSDDGERRYQITVGIPRCLPGDAGFPVIYMLDGNAVLAALNEKMLSAEVLSTPETDFPVIVAVGYETDLRFDVAARAFDYTPPLPDGSESLTEKARGRKSGGADLFAEFLRTKIQPEVESLVKIDTNRQTLWGHSYGGLFVLNTMFKHSEMFQNYFAADPSLWWENGVLLEMEKSFTEKKKLSLAVAVGYAMEKPARAGKSPPPNTPPNTAGTEYLPAMRRSVPPDAAKEMTQRLAPLLNISAFRLFEGLSHGEMFTASIEPALRFCVHPEAFQTESVGTETSKELSVVR
ncbi:MAG: prolyl oligopeptidase family serine peptidase [Planctomycetaceae bacterium]|jgi:predicted alpha/beta superfamily hydrolase|nr:prolyl oligopeptidase family serine peptidase [Planctomycetaceae bacterium]